MLPKEVSAFGITDYWTKIQYRTVSITEFSKNQVAGVLYVEQRGTIDRCMSTTSSRDPRGGKTEYENLQVLCSKCNLTKGNKDETDFRQSVMPDNDPECRFCHDKVKHRMVEEYGLGMGNERWISRIRWSPSDPPQEAYT